MNLGVNLGFRVVDSFNSDSWITFRVVYFQVQISLIYGSISVISFDFQPLDSISCLHFLYLKLIC